MYCSYHTTTFARVQCANCARGLCAACDHRIKGYPYCQDCIVLGIESLSRNYHQGGRPKAKARLAALCALLPGLGAAYNRQNVKAVVHFVGVVGLFQLTNLPLLSDFFGLAGVAFYFYTIIDAYHTAQRIAGGESPEADESRFKRQLAKRAPALGALLILAGVLLVIQIMRPLAFITPARLMPVALIILGGYLLTNYFKRSREGGYGPGHSERPPYPLPADSFADRTPSNIRHMSRRGDRR
jgi:TM2 domain-containing membrane protein YozV